MILGALVALFSGMQSVWKVATFGSLARGDEDRWSDIDILVISLTDSHFSSILDGMLEERNVVYRGPLTFLPETGGAHILGIVLKEESVFNCIDLNLMTVAEYKDLGALDRFGPLRDLFVRQGEPHTGKSAKHCP